MKAKHKLPSGSRRIQVIVASAVCLLALAAIIGYFVGYERIARKVQSVGALATQDRSHGEPTFPDIRADDLSETQQKIIRLTKQEFAAQSLGTKFSEGTKEAWCANFVSWVMKEAGTPLKNPHSGSWRIPGTFTLHEYYVAAGTFRAAGSGYTPKLGDVAIYRGSPIFGDHANIVLTHENGILTTVGGNENNRIRVYKNMQKQYEGLLGYGLIE